jgi:hypothetical protein
MGGEVGEVCLKGFLGLLYPRATDYVTGTTRQAAGPPPHSSPPFYVLVGPVAEESNAIVLYAMHTCMGVPRFE